MESLSQILMVIIFVAMFVVITIGKVHRFVPALIGAICCLLVLVFVLQSPSSAFQVLNLSEIVKPIFWFPGHEHLQSHGVNWQTIIFIGGMMVMVEGLAHAGFFRWLCLLVARLVRYKVIPILISFMLLSGFLSMFIDSITVLLFLASVTIELARMLKFDPVPVIISEIFAANVGGSATMAGDPPNIIIGTAFGYSFMDFLKNTGPIAWIGMIVALVFFYFAFRGILSLHSGTNSTDSHKNYPLPGEAIQNRSLFLSNTLIFLIVIVLLITHAETGISVATIGVIAAILTIIASRKNYLHIMKRVDWKTLVFFFGLFVVVGGLEITGTLEMVADYIQKISGGNPVMVMTIILWVSAFASAIVDNIPFAATMVPVISSLATDAGMLHSLSWTLALGTDIGGNATPIGASANVVGTAIAEREGYPISWGRFMKYALPSMIIVVGVCWVLLYIWHF